VLGPDQPLTTFGATAGALETPLSDGSTAIVTVRNLRSPPGQLAVIDPKPQAISVWRSDTALAVTLSATTGFVVLILGFAFHWQSTRAREADLIHEMVRRRVDNDLVIGREALALAEIGQHLGVTPPGGAAFGPGVEVAQDGHAHRPCS